MVKPSRSDIYNYLYDLFYGVVTENVYEMKIPTELTSSDTQDGFIVIYVGNVIDLSEFPEQAYGEVRCYVQAFIPQISRGRVNHDIYSLFENSINNVITDASEGDTTGTYHIEKDSVISADDIKESDADNSYFTFVKSFIVNIESDED